MRQWLIPTRRIRWSRRELLHAGGLAAASLGLGPARASPPEGFRVLRAKNAVSALRGDEQPSTPTLGFEGRTPGPLLRVGLGGELKVRLVNELSDSTAIHWHGVRLENAMDGTPRLTQPPVAPGERFDYRIRPRDAGTFWYHASGLAVEQVSRGLYGVLIVEEPRPAPVDREVVLVFDEWRLTSEGVYDPTRGEADYFTVNGRPHVTIPVRTNERLRLRLLNASVTRVLGLRMDGHPVTVMAIDGQPAEPFRARDSRVMLGPGNRIDLFIDAPLGPGVAAPVLMETETGGIPIARFVYASEGPARPRPLPPPAPLPANPLPGRMDFVSALKLDLPLDPVAGEKLWSPAAQARAQGFGPPLFRAARGRAVMLTFTNPLREPQSVHLHGHHFRLLDALDDGWKPFWLDTLLVMPGQTARIAFVAEEPGKWPLYALRLRAQADGMVTWFEVS